jgi:hypothetical protein
VIFRLDDQADVYVSTWRTARKHHRCCCCGHVVVPGSQYRCDSIVADGRAYSEKCCFACAAALFVFLEIHGAYPSPSWFRDVLQADASSDCRWGGLEARRRRKSELRAERDMLAGLLRRWRAAPDQMPGGLP